MARSASFRSIFNSLAALRTPPSGRPPLGFGSTCPKTSLSFFSASLIHSATCSSRSSAFSSARGPFANHIGITETIGEPLVSTGFLSGQRQKQRAQCAEDSQEKERAIHRLLEMHRLFTFENAEASGIVPTSAAAMAHFRFRLALPELHARLVIRELDTGRLESGAARAAKGNRRTNSRRPTATKRPRRCIHGGGVSRIAQPMASGVTLRHTKLALAARR